jgi:broad specificity phosphatase PhoE
MKNENAASSALERIPLAGRPACALGLVEGIEALWDDLRAHLRVLAHAHSVAALESQGVREGLVAIVAHGVTIGALLVVASMGAVAAMALWLAS